MGRWSTLISNHVGREGFGGVGQCVSVSAERGTMMRIRGYFAAGVKSGYPGLWARVDDVYGNVLAFDNMSGRGVIGYAEWKQYEINLPVVNTADKICFAAILTGVGSAYMDQSRFARHYSKQLRF